MAVGAIAFDSIQRLGHAPPVAGPTVMWVAAAGIVVNGITAWLFASGRHGDLNVKGAFLHMLGDAVVAAGVVVAAFVIELTGWLWLDPVASLVIAVVITAATWGLLRDAFDLAMDVVPGSIREQEVETYLRGLPGVVGVHDLHIWALSTTETALTAHLVRPDYAPKTRCCIASLKSCGRNSRSATRRSRSRKAMARRCAGWSRRM